MDPEWVRSVCLRMPGRIREEFPFGEEVLVFKVEGKIFLLLRLDRVPLTMNLKCDPERALELRERHPAVRPGYHMNKKHWNTVVLDGSLRREELRGMIDHSYDCVVRTLPAATRARLGKSGKT
jgi:predicted DNA-binding protein (MmcQ/YjbR family)